MTPPDFPPNSRVSQKSETPEKNLHRVTSKDAVVKKPSLRKQLSKTFVAGDIRSAIQYVVMDVALPSTQELMVEMITQMAEKLFMGEKRRRGGSTPPLSGPHGNIPYHRVSYGSRLSGPARVMSRAARSRHNFDEIILENRGEAEEVIDKLFEVVSQYEKASVADLYALVGIASSHADHRWGWTNLQNSGVSRGRGGYVLDLPEPTPLD